MQPVTHRREGHEGVTETPEMLAIFYQNYLNTPMAICFTDPDGTIIDANDSFLNLYGYRIDEVKGKNPRILKSGRQSPAVYQELWKAITDLSVGVWSGELINRKQSGEEAYVLLTISSVFKPDQTLIGYVASTIDITDRKEMELKLRDRNDELERLSLFKSDIMSVTSHDLKAPLNAIISYVTLLKENIEAIPPAKQEDYLGKILRYGAGMSQFISDILDLRMIETGRFKLSSSRVQLDAALRGCVEINEAAGRAKGIAISLTCTGRRRKASADAMKMEQVFNNLISNAVKFSPDHGMIRVFYEDDGSGTLLIRIEDQGPGIPPEELSAIFQSYYQVARKESVSKRSYGVGLGLSIVKSIMELHRGSVSAENLPEGGCRFSLQLPQKTVTSPHCLAVMIMDPRSAIFGSIEPPARASGMACFTVMNVAEAERTYEFESPDLIVVAGEDLSPEFTTFLVSVRERDPACAIVVTGHATAPVQGLFTGRLPSPPSPDAVDVLLEGVFADLRQEVAPS